MTTSPTPMDKRLLAVFILLLAAVLLVLLHGQLAAWQQALLLSIALLGARPLAEGLNRYAWLAALGLFALVLLLEVAKQLT